MTDCFLCASVRGLGPAVVKNKARVLEKIGIENEQFIQSPKVSVYSCKLPFYKNTYWYAIEDNRGIPACQSYFLIGPEEVYFLEGRSDPIHNINEYELILNRSNLLQYLRFFAGSICSDGSRFFIIEKAEDMEWKETPSAEYLKELNKQIFAPRIVEMAEECETPLWVVEAIVLYHTELFKASFELWEPGPVEMIDDALIVKELPIISDQDRLQHIGKFDENGNFTAWNFEE